ncbi:hypothetical protein [Phenylobacterium sp.]|uniref:hypothetical protein n=1 Tax=Phenylobacterium sp. TaxID=1871053 RepID=UPI002896A3C4|nr:hypothetical protein [Phenylobacterium sp.]
MTSPIDPIRRPNQTRRVKRSGDASRPESTDRSVPALYEPPLPPAPSAATGPEAAFAAHMLGQDGQKRGLRGGKETLDSARSLYNKIEYSGAADRRTPKGRTAKTEV